jgi:cell division protein FtsA
VKSAGINVRRHVLAPFGAAELISGYPNFPTDYILVDVGARVTTISLIGKNKLYGSTYISWGGENVTEHIASKLGINRDDAEKYKIMYGYDNRKMNFEAPVCTTIDENNIETKHMVSDMNEAIKSELETFVSKYNLAFNELLKDYDPSYKPLPMVLTGGGSQLIGLKEFVEPKVTNDKIYCLIPRSLGARNPSFTNILGVLKVNDKYRSVLDEMRPKITQVTRSAK